MDLGLGGQVVLVTGAGQGLGREIGLAFAREGAHVAFHYRSSGSGAEQAAAEAGRLTGAALAVQADVRSDDEVAAAVEAVEAQLGPIGVLVNNAAATGSKRFLDTTPEDWAFQVDVTVTGTLRVTQAVAKRMADRKAGVIVSLMGDSGRVGESGLSVTATTRASTMALTKSLAKELARFGIRANCVSIGLVETDRFDEHAGLSGTGAPDDERMKKILAQYPLRRLGRPSDVTPLVLLLASPLSGWITGQVISVNGGLRDAMSAEARRGNAVLGSPVPRKEDLRLLTGRGRYVSDLVVPGMLHAAFVRSPFAHAGVNGVDAAAARAVPGVAAVVAGDDPMVIGVRITARSELPSYVETSQPVLAWPKVRFAGEAVAVVVAGDRTTATDAAELVDVDYEPRPVVVDPLAAVDAGGNGAGAVVHDAAPDNVYLRRRFEAGDPDGALAASHLVLERTYRTNRQAGTPLEARAAVAVWDAADRTLTLWSGTQIPHLTRHVLAVLLGMAERRIRVVAPDVGGGFGVKASLYPEEVVLCLMALKLRRPVKWVESRSEHMVAAHHARDHAYRVKAGFTEDGRLTALVADAVCNAGAYSVYPWTAGLEPLMAGGLLPGPYRVEHYRCDVAGVATNTAPAGPYRGVARPATVYVMERLLDHAAGRLGLDPVELRRVNLITPEEIPYKAATRLVHDSRTYGTCLEQVLERLDYQRFRKEQAAARAEGRLLGVGFAVYNELTGLGRGASAGPRMSFRTGHEVVTVRLDPLGGVTVLTGASSQGQGIETTFAQIAAEALGVPYDDVEVRLGDTAAGGFGFGAFSSRQGVIGGGAVLRASEAVREKVLRIAAHLLEASPGDLAIDDGEVHAVDAPTRSVSIATVARVAYLESQRLPDGEEPGLEATRSYDPMRGTFAAGAQAAVVEVDAETGAVALRRFICVEDAGRAYHPVIVDGQVAGAVAQGIAGALFEHHVYDDEGQLRTATLADYLMPSAAELPSFELHHIEDPADNATGARGVGEGGTLGPAAALAGAVSDALGIDVDELPLSPEVVFRAARRRRG